MNTQKSNSDELLAYLKVVLQEAFDLSRSETRAAAGSFVEELALAL